MNLKRLFASLVVAGSLTGIGGAVASHFVAGNNAVVAKNLQRSINLERKDAIEAMHTIDGATAFALASGITIGAIAGVVGALTFAGERENKSTVMTIADPSLTIAMNEIKTKLDEIEFRQRLNTDVKDKTPVNIS